MKKIAFTSVVLIAAVAAIFIYSGTDPEPQQLQVSSQQDTQIDTSSSRDTFEYFLSGLGEDELVKLQEKFGQFNQQQSSEQQIDQQLFQQYLNYKYYLQTLEANVEQFSLKLEDLSSINDKLLAAQLKFFTPQEQQDLFGDENQLRELTLKRLALQQQTGSDAEYRALWQQELQQLPAQQQESYNNASLLSNLSQTSSMDEQEKYLMRQELVGAETAQRLAELDQKQASFDNQLDGYFSEREQILANNSLTLQDKNSAISYLREQTFTEKQQRRIRGLENIHDVKQAED
jgi:lipase chaperone LimK